MNKNTMYGLLACAVIALGAGAFWMASQQKNVDGHVDEQGMSFKTQSVSSFDCATANTGIPVIECEALVALYNSTDGDNWTRKDNWLNPNKQVSTWYGVTHVNNGSIRAIDLSNNKLSGSIPAEIGQLINLQYLYLHRNSLSGAIPKEIGQLINLENLELNRNFLSEPIPAEIGNLTNLKHLWLHYNILSGPIPQELGYLTNLRELYLYSNQLCGAIPTSFMFNGFWSPNNTPNQMLISQNNLLNDQASYSAAMRGWLKSKGFVDNNTNRIYSQTPQACGDTGGNGGSIGDSCGGENGECTEGYCNGYKPGQCVSKPGVNEKSCSNYTTKESCENYKPIINVGTNTKESACDRQPEQPGICKEELCGDGILDPREQCDGKGQAQCGKGATCSTTGKAPCTCQYSEVIGPEKLPDTTGDGDRKPGTNEDTQENSFPSRDLTR